MTVVCVGACIDRHAIDGVLLLYFALCYLGSILSGGGSSAREGLAGAVHDYLKHRDFQNILNWLRWLEYLSGARFMDSLRGQFLVASPHLPDPHFSRSVVFMLQHNPSGAVGVVLNRPTDNTIEDLWRHVSDEACSVEGAVHAGGPVAGPLMALHTNAELSEREIVPGVYVATDRDALTQLIQADDSEFRLYSGYAGWSAGQLEDELRVGGWLTAPGAASLVFSDCEQLWKRVLDSIGIDLLSTVVNKLDMPQDPSLN